MADALAGVLFVPPATRHTNVASLARSITRALDSCKNVIVVEPERNAIGRMRSLRGHLLESGVRFADDLEERDDGQQMLSDLPLTGGEVRRAKHDAGAVLRACNPRTKAVQRNETLDITPKGKPLSAQRLFQRAFSDCSKISVFPLRGGRSGSVVFRVDATSQRGLCLPFVAKIGGRASVINELRRYEHYVRDYVPFGNRPQWLANRSIVLGKTGILVGHFVERSIPIHSAVRLNGALGAIHDLFASVLHRWWANASAPLTTSLRLHPSVARWFDPTFHGEDRARREQRYTSVCRGAGSQGLQVLPLGAIQKRIEMQREYRWGRIHGDLNCGNVLVRGECPFVIDYSHCSDGPLLADPAWLEVNLVFGWNYAPPGARGRKIRERRDEWIAVVKELYLDGNLSRGLPGHIGDGWGDDIHHLCQAVRHIRQQASAAAVSRFDYPAVMSAALLRFIMRRDNGRVLPTEDELVRDAHAAATASAIAGYLGSPEELTV